MTGSPESSLFPLRLAAIDVGSNAIRFAAVEFVDATHWVDLEVQRIPVRLGHTAFITGILGEREMTAAVEAMGTFRRSLDNLGVHRYRAVATSAVRDSRNGPELVDRIRRETGIRLETITGSEEARLVWVAIRNRVELGEGRWIAADLGGGSLEISLVSREGIHWSESHTMGTVRLLEDLGQQDLDPGEFRTLLSEYTSTLRIPDRLEASELSGFIATGGNIEALADLAGVPADDSGVSRLSMNKLQATAGKLARMTVQERIERLGLREDRADVILPAAVIYEQVARLVKAREVMVPRVGVRDGVLWDLADDVTGPAVHASRLEELALKGALVLGQRYNFDELHGRHVARLALSIFDQLKELHGLGEADRRILLVASALHDVGQFVSYRKHHKHSLYLIHNSDIPGLSREDRDLAALVARYHRRAEPSGDHFLYGDLPAPERERVARLSSILRLADSLDREHLQRVPAVEARLDEDVLTLVIHGRGELLLEHWSLRKKSRMFASVFGVEVTAARDAGSSGPAVI